ncbi:MAG: adenylosuccinate synthetase [Dehalococcoidia bacterium]|nr:adenylosuccinate synthetase [Dehalococcoidia bacterium]
MRLCLEEICLSKAISYRAHLTSSDSLVTPYEETRAGFIALALEKNRKATPFVEEAKALKVVASRAKKPQDLPKTTLQFLAFISQALGTKLLMATTGPERHQTIKWY